MDISKLTKTLSKIVVPEAVPVATASEEPAPSRPIYRECDLGVLDGMSSYELAVKYGLFKGTEEEYVKKEQQTYDDMVEYCEQFKKDMGMIEENIMKRLFDLGDIADIIKDNIYNSTVNNGTIEEGDSISYTFRNDNSFYIGMEQDNEHGVQLRISWVYGLQFRYKNGTPEWSEWKSVLHIE